MFDTLEIDLRGAVGVIRLHQPATLNALSIRMIEELQTALDQIAPSVRALVVTSQGRAFCSGANLTGNLSKQTPGVAPDHGKGLETHLNPLMSRLRDLPVPLIMGVRGAAAGAGCSLALAGDLVIASETAYFMQAFVRIGLVPDAGATHLLARAIGRVRAMEMMMLGERIPAQQALEWGLINRVVADDQLDEQVLALAERLSAGPTLALGRMRRSVWSALDGTWAEALAHEREGQRLMGLTSDAFEGVAAFLEKRTAAFKGA